mgnify:FL=1
MSGICYKGRLDGIDIAINYIDAFEIINKAVILHNCDPVAAHILGRCMMAAIMSASILPEGHRINISWKYPGSLKTVVVDAGQDGATRAMIYPAQLSEAENKEELFGDIGNINVVTTKDGKILNSGTTPVSLHDPVNDLAYHFSISDQVETSIRNIIALKANIETPVSLAHGIMIQALPNCNLGSFERVRASMHSQDSLDSFKRLVSGKEILVFLENLAKHEKGFTKVIVEESAAPFFSCNCSKEKMSSVIRSLPIPERIAIVKKNEDVLINCHFCAQRYVLTIDECIDAWNTKIVD